jgi:anti-sigma-K factor RskA
MKYRNKPQLIEALAAEYVLGTLAGPARARLQRWLRDDAALRLKVAEWEQRLSPLLESIPPLAPPATVWRAIERGLPAPAPNQSKHASGGLWRWLALVSSGAAVAFGVLAAVLWLQPPPAPTIVVQNPAPSAPAMLAYLTEAGSRNLGMLVSCSPEDMAAGKLRVRIVQDHPNMPDGTSWELWALGESDAPPISIGLIGIEAEQVLRLDPKAIKALAAAKAIAMSQEGPQGSTSGKPEGPVLMSGPLLRI